MNIPTNSYAGETPADRTNPFAETDPQQNAPADEELVSAALILGEYFGATSESQSKKERAIFAKEDNCFIATSSIPQTLYEHDAGRKTQGPPRAWRKKKKRRHALGFGMGQTSWTGKAEGSTFWQPSWVLPSWRSDQKHLATLCGVRRLAFSRQTIKPMLIVYVHVRVRPEFAEAFRKATIQNAQSSIRESGIARFDVLQQNDDPSHFVLIEVYRNEAATKAHKETAHYAEWRDAVASMMAEPRTSVKFTNLFPKDEGW
jgi:autoinducer 2-degrading protein